MKVFDQLHVIGWNHDAQIAKEFHLPPLEPGQSNRSGTRVTCDLKSSQYVLGISTSANRQHNIICADESTQLLGKYIGKILVVRPRGDKRDVIGQGKHAEAPVAIHDCSFPQVTRAVRSQRGTPAIAKNKHCAILLVGFPQNIHHSINLSVGKVF
ncbi:MAG TPA: hypothetical protein VMB66_01160 [Candidatus Acidoferrales bacterium]|nr:hypothetical protein [Candidatus Acidoferrales bacterium]